LEDNILLLLNYKAKQIPDSLEELVDPAHTALLIADMQNDYLSENGFYNKLGMTVTSGDTVVKRTEALLQQARSSGILPILTQNTVMRTPSS